MKCPYRKETITTKINKRETITTEKYCDCYGTYCPFYKEAYGVNDESCAKAREDGGMN